MMEGTASVSAFLSPPLSLSGLSPQSNFNYVQLDDNDNAFTTDDGATYCIYDPSEYQIVYQPLGLAESEDAITFAFTDAPPSSVADENENNKVFQLTLEPESTKSDEQLDETELQSGEYVIDQEPESTENAMEIESTREQQNSLPDAINSLPTFYNDMAIALSNESETHETYLPLTFDEASHFLFHGREECVISTDIPTVETSSFASSTTSNNSFDSNISDSSARKKAGKARRPRINEGLIINRKVYKCPYSDCTFWAARGHRFHEHMCTHDEVRPFGCSECSYETNWKSDVKKHIARMIERNAKDHEYAVLTRITDKKIDSNRYKAYIIDLDVPVYMYSGRVGEPSRPIKRKSRTKNVLKTSPIIQEMKEPEPPAINYDDLISFSSTSNSSALDVTPPKKSRAARTKKNKEKSDKTPQPTIMLTQIMETEPQNLPDTQSSEAGTFSSSDFLVTREEVVEAPAATTTTIEPVDPLEIATFSEADEDPKFQDMITTDDGIMVKIISIPPNEQPQPVLAKPKASKKKIPRVKAVMKKDSKATFANPKSSEIWECTHCDYKHTSRLNVLNHMFRFHKLYGTSAKPTVNTSPNSNVPAKNSPQTQTDVTSQASQNFIVRGENRGDFHQYFLVVENGTKEGTTPRRVRHPDITTLNCDICPFIAENSLGLMRHKNFHGSRDENLTYNCPDCNFKSATRRDMEQHKHLHAQSCGKQIKVNTYSRTNLKRSELGKKDPSTVISIQPVD